VVEVLFKGVNVFYPACQLPILSLYSVIIECLDCSAQWSMIVLSGAVWWRSVQCRTLPKLAYFALSLSCIDVIAAFPNTAYHFTHILEYFTAQLKFIWDL